MSRLFLFQQPIWLELLAGLSAFGMAVCAAPASEVRDER